MGLNDDVRGLIRCVVDNDVQRAKAYIGTIIANETAEKNREFCKSIKRKLETPSAKIIELPHDLKEILKMEDVSVSFNESRYYLTDREKALFEQIESAKTTNSRLAEMGIRYINSTLLYGQSGTGKTTFGRYVAYKIGLPFAYVNFAHCMDSHLGGTGKNISKIFDYIAKQKCVLMLDEVDAIGSERGNKGDLGEMSRIVIGLMQAFDLLENDVIVIGATNRHEIIDEALKRRFSTLHEVKPLEQCETVEMIQAFLDDIGIEYHPKEVENYAMTHNKQSEIINDIVKRIVSMLKKDEKFSLPN